ncbi:hypothetical protein JOM56_000871 [Amanita muscaria]
MAHRQICYRTDDLLPVRSRQGDQILFAMMEIDFFKFQHWLGSWIVRTRRQRAHSSCLSLEGNPDLPRKAIEIQFAQLITQPFPILSGGGKLVAPTSTRVMIIDGLDECTDVKLQERSSKLSGMPSPILASLCASLFPAVQKRIYRTSLINF